MLMKLVHIGLIGVVLYFTIVFIDGVSLETQAYPFVPPLISPFAQSFSLLLALCAIVEMIIHPILRLILLPIRFITFGIASIILSAVLVSAVVFIYPPFNASIFWIFAIGFAFALFQKVTK